MTNPTGSILLRRGPTVDRLQFTPQDGEIIFDTDTKQVYVGDGITTGGILVAGEDVLPPQESQGGKFLRTNGTEPAWEPVFESPTFTGTVTIPTPDSASNTTVAASTAFVKTAISNLVDTAPEALDTLNELAAALNDDASFGTTVTNALAAKAPISSPTFTGVVTLSGSAETFSSPAIATNEVTCDFSSNSTFVIGSNSANVKALFTNVPTDAGKIYPASIIINQGATGYYINALSINGVDQTINWLGGTTPLAQANQTGVQNFAFVCTATSTYNVIVSFVSYN